MTNQNNDSETSGEAEIVEWLLKEVSLDLTDFDDVYNYVEEVNDLHPKAAEVIERLVAERDAAVNAEFTTRVNASSSVKDERQRAEAAEKRIAELKVTLNRVSADRDRWYKAARLLEAQNQQAMEALDRLADQAQRYMDASEEYFSDTTYDENGLLAEAHAELHGTLYDLRRARAALKGKKP